MNLHILLTVLKPERLQSQLLVFKTLRKGFPTSNVYVYGNGNGSPIHDPVALEIVRACNSVNAEYRPIQVHSHGEWIEKLMADEREPFWICDGDVVFFEKVEHWFDGSSELYAGRFEPEFWEEWTRSIHVSRLHPSLMWFNAPLLRAAIREWPGQPEFFCTVQHNLFQWNWVPYQGVLKFYDTCAGLSHAINGQPFNETQNNCFGHVFCGSYAHLISEQHPNLESKHAAVWNNPELARGMWAEQKQWYEQNSVKQVQQMRERQLLYEELTVPTPKVPPQ